MARMARPTVIHSRIRSSRVPHSASGTWKKDSLGYPLVINAFNPLQAEKIFQWTMYTLVSRMQETADGKHRMFCEGPSTRALKYRLGKAWPKWDGCRTRYSDCNPDSSKWHGDRALYEEMVVRCLAFQRGLIPEEEREWFCGMKNAADMFPADVDPEWKAERTGEFDWVSMSIE